MKLGIGLNGMQYHISHEVKTIKYYFADKSMSSDYTWTTDISFELAEQIKDQFANSMKKWNNVYYYSYDDDGNIISNKIINIVEGTYEDHNLIIYPSNSISSIANCYFSDVVGQPIEVNAQGVFHYHYDNWYINVNINSIKNNATFLDRTGAHEIGHIIGVFDVDQCCSASNSSDHHSEILMGYGSVRETDIQYKDIAGVSIARGFHTDADHVWMLRHNVDGTNDVICALCNGVRYNINLNDAEYVASNVSEYGYQSCVHHGGTNEEMILVATDLTRNFYTCRYCRHIEETEHTHIIELGEKDDFTHIGSCVCGYVSGEFEHEYDTFSQNNSITHIATCNCGKEIEQGHVYTHCKPTANNHTLLCECGHSEIENHNYSEWAKYNASFHIEKCLCGATGTIKNPHAVRLSDPIINGCRPCMTCGYLVPSDSGPTQIIHTITKYSVNGSYILPSGVIVLVDEDVEAYFNGTLVFYEKDKLPVTQ